MTYHILYAANQAYLQHAVVSMHSVLLNNRELNIHFHILYNEIAAQERERIKGWLKEGLFPNAQLSFYEIEANQYIFPIKSGDANSKECYFRILASDVLPDSIKTILYMDGDTICLSSIKEVFMMDIDGYAAACTEVKVPVYRKVSLGLKESDSYFQSGVMLMNLDWWRRYRIGEQCLAFIRENPDILPRWDQDAMNAVLVGKIKKLDSRWNVYLDTLSGGTWGDVEPRIVHYTGSVLYKPWYKNSISEYQYIYLKYREYTPYEKNELQYVEGVRYMFWKDLLSKSDRVVLYGAGKLGKAFYQQNLKNNFCEIVLWVDKRFRGNLMGRRVESLLAMQTQSYDYILLAVEEEVLAFSYASELIAAGVDENKILWKRSFGKKKAIPINTLEGLEERLMKEVFVYGADSVCGSLICYCKRERLLQNILKIAIHGHMKDFKCIEGICISCLDDLDCINRSILIAVYDMGNLDIVAELQDRGFKEILYLTYPCYEMLRQANRQAVSM